MTLANNGYPSILKDDRLLKQCGMTSSLKEIHAGNSRPALLSRTIITSFVLSCNHYEPYHLAPPPTLPSCITIPGLVIPLCFMTLAYNGGEGYPSRLKAAYLLQQCGMTSSLRANNVPGQSIFIDEINIFNR